MRQDWPERPRKREEEKLDPHVYERGINGLTVQEATDRATGRIIKILGRSGEGYTEFERRLVHSAVRAALISQIGRASLYRIAGILVADRRDEGAHRDTSLAVAYVDSLRKAFFDGFAVGEWVLTPLGEGEVRYVSEDGAAVVELESGEVWLPVEGLSPPAHPEAS